MTHPLVAALDNMVWELRDSEWPLGRRLLAIADEVRARSPEFAMAVDTFVNRLEAAEAGASAPQIGDPMPHFTMPDQDGRLVSLQSMLDRGPVVLVFHRGHWCPYCRINVKGLAEIQDQLGHAQICSISAELQTYTRKLRDETGARFPLLTDTDAGYALSINLAIWVDEFMASLIGGAGWDIPGYQGGQAWILPVPSVFILDCQGIIRTRHVDPDYRRRMELDAIVAGVAALGD
ncbi:peroxiredoxin [Novosphingobium sp.]|uniref:peroxiredoxin family protein n=1 Tax=Novosphingobium sp. TaxID=1874826 RepID=UPI0025E5A7F2|nr:redoxin domain-containing protein [Novosphingobium sp.]